MVDCAFYGRFSHKTKEFLAQLAQSYSSFGLAQPHFSFDPSSIVIFLASPRFVLVFTTIFFPA
jgi:hypothetical protein